MYEVFYYTVFTLSPYSGCTTLLWAHGCFSGLGRAEYMLNVDEGSSQNLATCSSVHMPKRRALSLLAAGGMRFVWVPGEARLVPAPGPPGSRRGRTEAPPAAGGCALPPGFGSTAGAAQRDCLPAGWALRAGFGGARLSQPGTEQPRPPRTGAARDASLCPYPRSRRCREGGTVGHQPLAAAGGGGGSGALLPRSRGGPGLGRPAPLRPAPRPAARGLGLPGCLVRGGA